MSELSLGRRKVIREGCFRDSLSSEMDNVDIVKCTMTKRATYLHHIFHTFSTLQIFPCDRSYHYTAVLVLQQRFTIINTNSLVLYIWYIV